MVRVPLDPDEVGRAEPRLLPLLRPDPAANCGAERTATVPPLAT
jgi:hypothetical protein